MKLKVKIVIILAITFFGIIILSNQTEANSVQNALWFMDDLNITQKPDDDFSHHNTQNFDVVGVNSNNIFAPFDCKVVDKYDSKESGHTVVIQSINQVNYADGTVDYMSMGFAHDDNIDDLYVGKIIKQGEIFYQTGNFGTYSTGSHSHVTCIRGKYWDDDTQKPINNMWAEDRGFFLWNGKQIPIQSPHNDIAPTSALFITQSTNIYETMGLQFKYIDKLTLTIDKNYNGKSKLSWNEIPGATSYSIGIVRKRWNCW